MSLLSRVLHVVKEIVGVEVGSQAGFAFFRRISLCNV